MRAPRPNFNLKQNTMLKYQRLAQCAADENITSTPTTITTATTATTATRTTATAAEKAKANPTAATSLNTTTTTRTTAATVVGNASDADNEQFSMFFTLSDNDDDDSDVAGNNNKHKRRDCSHTSTNNYEYNNNNNNNNYNNNFTTTIGLLAATDESTMEVPLLNCNNNLNNNNNSNNNANKEEYHEHDELSDELTTLFDRPGGRRGCLCDQRGFGAPLTNKSAQEAKLKIILAIAMCLIFMVVEFLGGYLAGSLAIVTDAAHLASDCIAFVIGLVAIWLGDKAPDARMSFGYKRMEVLGAIISIIGIWILTATLFIVAVQRLLLNDFDLDAVTMMIISGIGIFINIAMIYILHGSPAGHGQHSHSHGHSHGHGHAHGAHLHDHRATATAAPPTEVAINLANGLKQQQHDTPNGCSSGATVAAPAERNLNLRAALIHVIGDLVQSVGVFLAAVLIHFYPDAKFADPLCTLLFSIIVILTTVQLFRESVRVLMDAVPSDISLPQLADELARIEGVNSVHHLNVWSHTTNHSVLMAHLVIDFLSDSNEILSAATQLASRQYNIKHCTIQVERSTP